MPQSLHLQPGYTVDLAHLRHRITLAEDLTLGALCESLERMDPRQRAALEAILGYPLAPWLDDCRCAVLECPRTNSTDVDVSSCTIGEAWPRLTATPPEAIPSEDNGAEKFTWPDGGQSPFRGEKNTNWEGGYRVPCAIRWPGVITPGTVLNDIFAYEDMLPTLLAAAGEPNVKAQLLKGVKVGDKTVKVHLDGYNLMDALAGKSPSPRHEFFYFNDDGSLVGLRYDQWKVVFAEQRAHGFDVWQEPFVSLRLPKLFNLRSDPFETADHEGMDYERWRIEHIFVLVPAQQYVGKFLGTFQEFPPSQKPGSFSIDQALNALQKGTQGGGG